MTPIRGWKSPGRPLAQILLCVWALLLCGAAGYNEDLILNPVGRWVPVVTEFLLAGGRVPGAGNPGPPFVKIASRFPSIPSAWDVLKDMAAVKNRAYYEDEPVIGGWQAWTSPDPNNKTRLLSGIEVKRSDYPIDVHKVFLPVVALEIGPAFPVQFKVEIWGRHRLTGRDDRQYFSGDLEYQKFMKQKIQVTDFSLTVHKLEGEFSYKNIKNRALPEAAYVIAGHRGGLDNSLAAYEAQEYRVPIKDVYMGELRLEMSLRFPEAERLQPSAYDIPVKVCLRFISGSKKSFLVISDEVRKK